MPYVPTSTTAYTTVTVTHTTTHTVTATALQSSTSSNSSAAAFGDINNTASVIALASFGFSAAVGVVRYARGITSSTKIDHWRKLVKQWREWEQTLSTEQRDILMQENPTLIKQLDDELSRLDQALETLEWNHRAGSTIQRWGYYSDLCKEYRNASQAMDKMKEVWSSSTQRYRKEHPFLEEYTVAYPDGVAPPPPGLSERAREQFNSMRAAINRQTLDSVQARGMMLIESMWAFCQY